MPLRVSIDHENDAGQRFDKFLKKYLPNAPLTVIYKYIRTGKIKVNNKKTKNETTLKLGDEVVFHMFEHEIEELQKTKETPPKTLSDTKTLDILYEDETLLVVNKPPKLNVHPGDHKTTEVSLIEQVQDYLAGKHDSLTFKPALVHRIDRDTSGVILIAKTKGVLEGLLWQLQNNKITKVYHSVVIGVPKQPGATIDKKLLRIENAKSEAKVRVDEAGQTAITHYTILQENIHAKYSLLECRIETGRTHQIRVHLASEGFPILGDDAYGNKKENAFARRQYGIERQLLHAFSLDFRHPITKKELHIEAPYREDMYHLLQSL